ncbi:MAG: flagellar basal body-associated FliL family protein [Spirochaetaceae bacterium]|jgi:flagellar FliL protein|nr:flagellar basal body-associated FliL family protein [Spirochaetaceae bacterium]
MKQTYSVSFGIAVQRFLVLLLIVMLLLIAGVTLWAFVSGTAVPGQGLRRGDPSPEAAAERFLETQEILFEELGRLRAITADDPPITVIITPYFPYPEGDTAFQEELLQKTRQLRSLITDYFSRLTMEDILARGEQSVKAELLQGINSSLVLGAVDRLYFSDYIFLE